MDGMTSPPHRERCFIEVMTADNDPNARPSFRWMQTGRYTRADRALRLVTDRARGQTAMPAITGAGEVLYRVSSGARTIAPAGRSGILSLMLRPMPRPEPADHDRSDHMLST